MSTRRQQPMACRVCAGALFDEPLFRFEGMPAVAQNFPDASALAADRGSDFDVAQCSACGLVQLTCEPVAYFRDVIRAAGVSKEMAEHRRAQFSRFVARFALASKPVIEIGCGGGEYLERLAETGVGAVGLEHGATAVEACRRRGLRAIQGFVESPEYVIPGAPFDGFLMLSCLEHLPDVNGVLAGIRHNLVAGGVGLVEVPSFDMILHEQTVNEFMTDHLFYFTTSTLTTTLERNGFEVLDCQPTWHDYILTATVRARARHDVSGFNRITSDVRRDVDAFVDALPPRSVVVWGAGHQALAAMVLYGLTDRVAYVVDSAPFKQGRFTPATHLPVRSPEQLATDRAIRGVLIMGASYSDEIASILERDFPQTLALAILRPAALELRKRR